MKLGKRSKQLGAGVTAIAFALTGVIGMATTASAGADDPYATLDYGDTKGHLDFSIDDKDLARLNELGVELQIENSKAPTEFYVKSTSDGSAFPSNQLDNAPHHQGVSAYVIGGAYNYDQGLYQSPFEEGDSVDNLLLQAEGSEADAERGAPVSFAAHTSYHPGGVPQNDNCPAPLRTWITDHLANTPGSTHDQVIEDAGLVGHNPETYSDATDGSSSLTIQVFAQGYNTSDWQETAIALTDGITIHIDTSSYNFGAAGNKLTNSNFFSDFGTEPALPADANDWKVQKGFPVLYNDAGDEGAVSHDLYTYSGALPSDEEWVEDPPAYGSEERALCQQEEGLMNIIERSYNFGYNYDQATDNKARSIGEPVDIKVMGNDSWAGFPSDEHEFGDITEPANGSAEWVETSIGIPTDVKTKAVRYTPDDNFEGEDTFTYTWTVEGHPVSADVSVETERSGAVIADNTTSDTSGFIVIISILGALLLLAGAGFYFQRRARGKRNA